MTDPNFTAIAIVLDRSGSMAQIKSDAEGALRQFIEDQKKVPGKCVVSLTTFDDKPSIRYRMKPLQDISRIHLEPRGMTALYDAIGVTITKLGEDLAGLEEERRPGKVLFVIITDGHENHSQEWTQKAVFDAITRQRNDYSWEFVYLAAGQDAMEVGMGLGIRRGSTMTMEVGGEGYAAGTRALSGVTTRYRGAGGQAVFLPEDQKS